MLFKLGFFWKKNPKEIGISAISAKTMDFGVIFAKTMDSD